MDTIDTNLGPTSEAPRIFVLGESQSAGEYLENHDTLAYVLGELLIEYPGGSQFELVNIAVSAYSPRQERLGFREQGHLFQPEITIAALYVGDDLIELVTECPVGRPYLELSFNNQVDLKAYPVSQPNTTGIRDSGGPVEAVKRLLRPLSTHQLTRSSIKSNLLSELLREIGLMNQDPVWSADMAPQDSRPGAASICHG